MRSVLTEGDIISAEVQSVAMDGIATLHTQSLQYGKKKNGQLMVPPAALIQRM